MRFTNRALALCLIVALACLSLGAFTVGQKVEVREGDKWSAATVKAVEGRRFQVHYDGADAATDEWVETDRIRVPETAGPATPATTKPARLANADYSRGDKIETKWGGSWRKTTVFKKSGEWTMVCYDGFNYEWVQPWRLRKIGSTTDCPNATPRATVDKTSAAPTFAPLGPDEREPSDEPAAAPARRHGRGAAAGDDAKPEVVNGTPEPADVDGRMNPGVGPGNHPLVKPDLSGGKDIEPGVVVATTRPIDINTTAPAPHMISLNHGAPKFGVRSEVLINPQGKAALLAFQQGFGGDETALLQRIDLSTQDSGKVLAACPHVWPVAISLDGSRIVTRSDRQKIESRWRLDVWSMDGSAVKPLLSFRPYDPSDHGTDGVNWAQYVDANHLMTCSSGHLVTLWELSDTSVKEVYSIQGDFTVQPQMTSTGRQLVVGFGTKLCVCDAMTGQCLMTSAVPAAGADMLVSVRPDLKKIAMLGHQRLIVMDVTNELDPTSVLNMGLPEKTLARSLDWVKPNLLLIGKQWLYDTDHNALVWRYQTGFGEPVAAFVGERLWFMAESGSNAVGGAGRGLFTSVVLPDQNVMLADKKTPDGEFVLKPGGAVSLQVSVNGTTEEHDRIVAHLTEQLKEANISVADNAPVHLVAETKNGQTRTQQYTDGPFGRGGGTQSVSATSTIYSISYVVDGKPVWATTSETGGYLPMFISHPKDQSLSDAISAENKPQLQFFYDATIPTSILKPQSEDGIGTSPLGTLSGRTRNAK